MKLIASHVTGGNNSRVIPTGVVTGIGFLGAGTILRADGGVFGLTTAATILSTSAIGLLIGYAMFVLGVFSTVLIFFAIDHSPLARLAGKRCKETAIFPIK